PSLFHQVYVISVKKHGGVLPVIYAVLPNKRRTPYNLLFETLKELVQNLNPGSICCDFESADFTAMQQNFDGVTIKGCFFHLVKNMKHKLSQLGLLRRYANEVQFALHAKMIVAVAFVPLEHIDAVILELDNFSHADLRPLLNWFEDNYMGRPNRREDGQEAPIFPISMWNLYNRVLNNEDRTNNHPEEINRMLKSQLGIQHPTIWQFINTIRKLQKGRDLYYEQLIAGNRPPLKLRKYRDTDQRILRLVEDFINRVREPIDFLRGIAYNYGTIKLVL
ncbi:hypothetical protein PPYR_06261, partial [Photinus pyralis]